MAKLTLTDIAAGYTLVTTTNANNTLLETAVENTLSRDGTTPNTMSADLDLNSNKVTNVTDGTNNQDAVTLAQLVAASITSNSTTAALTTIADGGGFYGASSVEAALAELASIGPTGGGQIIGIFDSAGNYTATDVEGALAELGSVATGEGASIIGVEDAGGDLTATNVEAALAEIIANAAADTLSYETGSFTVDWVGFDTSPQSTMKYVRQGKIVCLWLGSVLSATSNTNLLQSGATDLPAAIRPTESLTGGVVQVVDNGTVENGKVFVSSTGVIQVLRKGAAAFTTSGTKGLGGGTMLTYHLM